MKLIDAEKLEEYKVDCCVPLTEWQEGWNDAIDIIMNEAPIVDTVPTASDFYDDNGHLINNQPTYKTSLVRHGHWVRNDNGTYSCSECQSWIPNEQHYYARYCLFCGTKMDEEKENE